LEAGDTDTDAGAGVGLADGWLVRKLKLALLPDGWDGVFAFTGFTDTDAGAGAGEDPAIMASKLFK
jgi:hypothetical protein